MVIKKRSLLWDYTNTEGVPKQLDKVNFNGPLHSVSNWNAWYPTELKNRAPFRPMIRQKPQIDGEEWKWIVDSKESIVHFFNEPERGGISPKEAADYWHKKVVPTLRKQKGKKLVSPSCASDPAGQKWIADWMALVKDAPPDYLGVHWYGTSADECTKYMENMHKKFPHQKLIISEIASISRNRGEVTAFTKTMCNWLDEREWVFEYAFFGCLRKMPDTYVSEEARLMNPDGSFTNLMLKYMNEQPMK